MANDINDDSELIPNHNEAWSLAHFKRGTSNMARAYIELRQAVKDAYNPDYEVAVLAAKRLEEISKANDL